MGIEETLADIGKGIILWLIVIFVWIIWTSAVDNYDNIRNTESKNVRKKKTREEGKSDETLDDR